MKVVYISSMLPSGHFSQILTNAINQEKNVNLIIYTDKNPRNLEIENCGTIKNIWSKNLMYIFDILKNINKDKPDAIHIQQEFNMYGSIPTAIIFPLLPLLLKLLGYKTVVTVHAAVYKKQVDKDFIHLFTTKKSRLINPSTLKMFFYYVYKSTAIFANRIICHTNLMKDILVSDWGVDKNKITVIPTGIPKKEIGNFKKSNYFFYFGYMVRRKGLEYILEGFKDFIKKYGNKFQLIMAGGTITGQEEALDEVKQIIHDYNLEKNVVIKGFVEEKDLDGLYSKALAVVIPAKVSMGSSGPLYQAQSYGKCILASDVGHFKEDIKHLHDGILVDNDKWDEAFMYVVNNSKKVSEIEKNVLKKARNKSSSKVAKKHIEIYRKVAHEI